MRVSIYDNNSLFSLLTILKHVYIDLEVMLFCSYWQRTDITVFCHWVLARTMILLRMHGLWESAMAPFHKGHPHLYPSAIHPDATFGLIRNENDSVWFRVNAKSVSKSFGIQSVWMGDGIIRTERVVARNHSDWTGNGTVSFGMTFSSAGFHRDLQRGLRMSRAVDTCVSSWITERSVCYWINFIEDWGTTVSLPTEGVE